MKIPINLYLATSTSCNVQCKTCPAGRKEDEPGGIMSLEMMDRILKKCIQDTRLISCQLHHFNEPTIIPHIGKMIELSHSYGVPVFMSSNLVIVKNLRSVMDAAPDTLLISVSGWTQAIYERSHAKGDIEKVKENMKLVQLYKKPGTHVQVSWHKYRYNEHEEPLMKAYAEELGFQFVAYGTGLLTHDRAMKVWKTGIEDPNGADCLVPVMEAKDKCFERKAWPCLMEDQILAVNGEGMVLNCSNYNTVANLRGSLFDGRTVREIIKKRATDIDCIKCKAVGGHIYAMQCYTRGQYSPLRIAENIYRKLGMAGMFPSVSKWFTHHYYVRPQKKETL